MKIAGCILAGGRSSRFGSDKALVMLNGRSLLEHAVERLRGQVNKIVINANGDTSDYRFSGLPVISDIPQNFDGPLAGVLAGLDWAVMNDLDAVVTVAVDAPLFPLDLAARLLDGNRAVIAVAESASGLHPTFALWPTLSEPLLRDWLACGASRRMTEYLRSQRFAKVVFETTGVLDPFFNINTQQDLRTVSAQFVDRLT